jgi:hypothetical protein
VHVAFAASMACYFLFMIGWRTRLFSILSTLWVTSMDNRLVLVENGGYVVVNLMCFWAMFLPTGKRFSVDSLVASLRNEQERTPHDLDRRCTRDTTPLISLAALALFVNFVIVYVFNVVNKYGQTWRDGLTIHYVLHIDRMVTGLAVWVRETFPFGALWAVNHLVLMVEASIVVLIFWPTQRLYTRPVAMMLIAGLHVSFGIMMRLGPFSWFMVGWSTVLLTSVHWQALALWYGRKAEPVTVRYRPEAFQLCRFLKRLDGVDLLRFELAPDQTASVTVNGVSGRRALWAIAGALPAGRWFAPAARVLSLGVADLVLAWIARPVTPRFLGWRAPRIDSESTVRTPQPVVPIRAWAGKWVRRLREATLVYLLLCAVSQLINENKSIPALFHHPQPLIVRATLQYPRIFQGWGMFSPNPIREDGIVAIDARTADGRLIDPFTGDEPDLDLSDARGLAMNQIHQDYFNRIRLDHNRGARKPLGEWIQRWHTLMDRPDDEIVAYDIWWLRDQNPVPGSLAPTSHEKICIGSWRKPLFRVPKGQPPLGPTCRVVSAEEDKDDKDKKDDKKLRKFLVPPKKTP